MAVASTPLCIESVGASRVIHFEGTPLAGGSGTTTPPIAYPSPVILDANGEDTYSNSPPRAWVLPDQHFGSLYGRSHRLGRLLTLPALR